LTPLRMSEPASQAEWPSPRRGWYAVTVLVIAYLFSYVDRQILSMLVGDTQVSLLHGLAFAVCYTLLGVWPVGRWADTGNRRNVIAGGVFLWSCMTVLCGRATSYGSLFLARIGVGIGEAALTPSAYSLIADYFPPEKRGRALGIFAMGVYLGIGAAIMITGLLVQAISANASMTLPLLGAVHSWQIPFLVLGPPGVLVSLWLLSIQEPPRRGLVATGLAATGGETPGFRIAIAHAGFYVALTLGISLLTMLFNAVAFWVPAHLIRAHGFTPVRVAFSFGPIMFCCGALGTVAGGMLADRLRARGHLDAEIRVGILSALLLWPIAVLTFQVKSDDLVLVLLAPVLFLASLPFGAASSALQLVTPNRLRARVSALYLLLINLTGIGFGATAASLVSDYILHDDRRIGDGVSLVAAITTPLAVLALWSARRHFRAMQT
jgi:MFS family permease